MSQVKAVLFDLDHTLFDTHKTERRALGVVAKAADIRLGVRNLEAYRTVNLHVWGEYRAGRITSKELRVLRFHLWLEKLGRDPSSAKHLAPLYLDHFSSHGDLISGAPAALRGISSLGLRLGVVTNGIDRVQRRRLRASELMDSFTVVVTSERAGFTKPDPRIMDLALKRMRVRPDEALYVGDDAQVDGLAANRAGVPFVWFNPQGTPTPANIVVSHQLSHLKQLSRTIQTL